MAEFLFRLSWISEERQLLWVTAISVEVTGGDADQPDFLLQRKLAKE